jgi:beta-mannosidase
MESCPSPALIAASILPVEHYPQSRGMDHHNKSTDGPRRLAAYLNDTLRVADTLPEYIYATQFVQAEALAAAYRGWRRRWQGPGHYAVAGALVWQLDDCWPVTSWAIVDYARRPKPAYYVIRRALAPLTVDLAGSGAGAEIWAVNGRTQVVDATLELAGFTLDGTQVLAEERPIVLAPNRAVELGTIPWTQDVPAVLAARLRVNGTVQARATLWPEPFKYLVLPDPAITIDVLGGDRLQIQAARPAKGVWLTAQDGVRWSDNMLDLLPGDPQIITGTGLGPAAAHAEWLGSVHS